MEGIPVSPGSPELVTVGFTVVMAESLESVDAVEFTSAAAC